MKCKTCEYFKDHGSSVGECRKTRPESNKVTNQAQWPLVKADDWCGDFRQCLVDIFNEAE